MVFFASFLSTWRDLGDGLGIEGEPAAKGEAADGNGLPKEAGLFTGEGTINPGEGVGWFEGPGDACGGKAGDGLGCLIFGPVA